MSADTPPTTVDSGVVLSGYEEIRSEALRRSGSCGRGGGLALFVRRGMAAWLAACAPALPAEGPRLKPIDVDHVPPDLRAEVAMILAEMAMTAAPTHQGASC